MGPNRDLSCRVIILALVGLGLALFGCTSEEIQIAPIIKEDGPGETIQVTAPTSGSVDSTEIPAPVVEGGNQFALELYSKYAAADKENLFFSPYSISAALTMTYEGARGRTAEEMRQTLRLPDDKTQVRTAFTRLYDQINQRGTPYELSTANALWAQNNYHFLRSYFNIVTEQYRGTIANLDFMGNPEGSRQAINQWVADQTNQAIEELIEEGKILPDIRLVITNAIYLKADWDKQFETDKTQSAPFKLASGKERTVKMMNQTGYFNYRETPESQILEMDYVGNDLSMLFILPRNKSLTALENVFDQAKLAEWKTDMKLQNMHISIPKFRFSDTYDLSEDLQSMGMSTAFNESADFSGMTGGKELAIAWVIHQADVEVAEYGTEAAASTAVAMRLSMPDSFVADHPFIFLIQHKASDSILFMGRVNDPTKE